MARWCIASLVFCLCRCDLCAGDPGSAPTREGIWRTASANWATLKCMKVEYDVSWRKLTDSVRDAKLSFDPFHVSFAYQGERRVLRVRYSVPPSMKWLDKGFEASFDGRDTLVRKHGILIAVTGKAKECEDLECYCASVLDLAYTDYARANYDNGLYYPHCIRPIAGRQTYRLRREPEVVDGAACYVLEFPGHDKLWVDPRLGFRARRRVRYWTWKKDQIPALRYRYSGFIEAAPRIWLPTKCVTLFYPPLTEPRQRWGVAYAERTINVRNITVNDVGPGDFEMAVAPGTVFLDKDGQHQVRGDKTVMLQSLADAANLELDKRRWRPSLVLVLNAAAVILVSVSYLVWRWRDRRRRAGHPPVSATTEAPPNARRN